MMLYTTKQIDKGVTDVLTLDMTGYAKKDEVVNKDEYQQRIDELTDVVANKLDAAPMHHHDIQHIDQLSTVLSNKLDGDRRYSHRTLISDIETIDYVVKLTTDEVVVNGVTDTNPKMSVKMNTVDDIVVKHGTNTVAKYVNELNMWNINGVTDVLANHAEAIETLVNEGGPVAPHTHTSFEYINTPSLWIKQQSDGPPVAGYKFTNNDVGDLVINHDMYGEEVRINESGIVAPNVKADNELRLASVESGKADVNDLNEIVSQLTELDQRLTLHTHTEFTNVITAPNVKADNESRLVSVEYKLNADEDGVMTHDTTRTGTVNYNQFNNSWITFNGTTYTHVIEQTVEGKPEIYITRDGVNVGYTFTWMNNTTNKYGGVYVTNYVYNISDLPLQTGCVYELWSNEVYNSTPSPIKVCDITTKQVYDRLTSNDDKVLTQKYILNMVYPIGSIYTSMNNTSPATLFGGVWEQIVDRFMYCTSSTSLQTGGSKKISVNQLPAHEHGFRDYTFTWHWGKTHDEPYHVYANARCTPGASDNNHIHTQPEEHNRTKTVGNGDDYMPPYITVYAWYRVG